MASSPDVKKLSKNLAIVIEESKKRVVLGAMANLIQVTPVATGHARSNWVPTIDTPYAEVDGSQENVSHAAQAKGIIKIQGLGRARDLDGRFVAREVYITNNVPYIRDLNNGTSGQAPPGFVQTAVEQAGGEATGNF